MPAHSKIFFLALIFVAVVLEAVADVFMKQWSLNNFASHFVVGLLFYLFATTLWALSLRYEELSRAVPVFMVLNIIVILVIGALLFKEKLTAFQMTGIALGIVSIILIES